MSCSVGDDTPMDILNEEATSIWAHIQRDEKLIWKKRKLVSVYSLFHFVLFFVDYFY